MEETFANQVKQYLISEGLWSPGEEILLAVSGGVDSVVLAHLFKTLEVPFRIAHCNFQLRGEESNQDALFVRQLADQLSVPYHEKVFATQKIKNKSKGSMQMVARDLRYDWLEQLARQLEIPSIATAHHRQDSLETVLLNWIKGTGIRGLTGVPARRGRIIRPLNPFSKKEILAYQRKHQIPYREDRSNRQTKYTRNQIRLQVFPVLRAIHPAFDETAWQSTQFLRETNSVFQWASAHWQENCMSKRGKFLFIQMSKLDQSPSPLLLLSEWLRSYGFHADQAQQAYTAFREENVGVSWISKKWELLVDRQGLFLRAWPPPAFASATLSGDSGSLALPSGEISWETVTAPPPAHIPPGTVWLDAEKLEFPLIIEPWQPGDRFAPDGLDGKHQKVKKYLTDLKLNRFQKEGTLVLKNAGQICWIIGYRVDENHKSLATSQRSVLIVYKPFS